MLKQEGISTGKLQKKDIHGEKTMIRNPESSLSGIRVLQVIS